jgi:hypothetical protein
MNVGQNPTASPRRHIAALRRFRDGAAESKAVTIRFAKQELKCHYNGVVTLEVLEWLDLKTARKPGRSV